MDDISERLTPESSPAPNGAGLLANILLCLSVVSLIFVRAYVKATASGPWRWWAASVPAALFIAYFVCKKSNVTAAGQGTGIGERLLWLAVAGPVIIGILMFLFMF